MMVFRPKGAKELAEERCEKTGRGGRIRWMWRKLHTLTREELSSVPVQVGTNVHVHD